MAVMRTREANIKTLGILVMSLSAFCKQRVLSGYISVSLLQCSHGSFLASSVGDLCRYGIFSLPSLDSRRLMVGTTSKEALLSGCRGCAWASEQNWSS